MLALAVSLEAAPQRRVAFTFDDLPGLIPPPCTFESFDKLNRKLVTAIVRNKMPATALVVESNLCRQHRGRIDRLYDIWLSAGLELGNHTYSHRDFNTVSLAEYEKDVLDGERTLRPLLARRGKRLRYFRFPYLRSGTELRKKRAFEEFLRSHGYVNAPVTIDNDEYIYAAAYQAALKRDDAKEAARIAADYIRYMDTIFAFYEKLSRDTLGYELPQILLLHVNQLNADHLDGLVAMTRKRGYTLVSMEEALRDEAYARVDNYVGRRGLSWLHRWSLDDGKNAPAQPEPPEWVMQLYRDR